MGTPNVVRSDNGPQFEARKTQDFFKNWNITWRPSSPHNPQSNGHAETMVKNVKYLIIKNEGKFDTDECQKGLLELRNAPKEDGLSPAQRLFGRPLRSDLPMHWKEYDEKWLKMFEKADCNQIKIKNRRRKHCHKT